MTDDELRDINLTLVTKDNIRLRAEVENLKNTVRLLMFGVAIPMLWLVILGVMWRVGEY